MNINTKIAKSAGREHWTEVKGQKLFLWEKPHTAEPRRGTILFVHGSSMASTPGFDLQAPGVDYVSAMDWFAAQGFDTWTVDHRGYGRSYKGEDVLATIADGADDLDRGQRLHHVEEQYRRRSMSTASRRGRCARHCSPNAIPSGSSGSRSTPMCGPARAARRSSSGARSSAQWKATTRRPINRDFIHSIHTRDNVYTVHPELVEPYMQAVLALDNSVPNGTYIDMCENLPVNDPAKITVPTIVMRGQYDGIAGSRRPDRVLQAAAQCRQGIRHHARHRARLVHPDELHAGLSYAVFVPHPARARPSGTEAGSSLREIPMRAGAGLRILIVLAAVSAALPATAMADELVLLSAAALRPALLLAPSRFERASGHHVTLGFGNASVIQNKVVAGERVDVVVLPPKQIDELADRGLIASGSRSDLGVVRLGIAARLGSAMPHIGTVEEFKRALLAASSFGMPDPADGSTSSLYLAELLRRLDLTEAMRGRTRLFADGTKALQEIAKGNLALTVAPITSIRTVEGVELVDSLPETLQLKTLYAGAIPVATPSRQAASALLAMLKAPEFAANHARKGNRPAVRPWATDSHDMAGVKFPDIYIEAAI